MAHWIQKNLIAFSKILILLYLLISVVKFVQVHSDGFPTASCTEAALRGSAIFAVDEFNSAEGYFTDGEDIVLIQYNIMHIVDKIEKLLC